MKSPYLLVGVFIGCVLFTGCGYSSRSLLPSHFRTIHVESFKNKVIYETGSERHLYIPFLEVKITNAVVDRFLFDGNLKITNQDKADLILKGELLQFERQPLRYVDATEEVQEYRIQIIVSLILWDAVKDEIHWQEPAFAGESTYFVTGALAKSESVAIDDALTDLARRIVGRTIEDW